MPLQNPLKDAHAALDAAVLAAYGVSPEDLPGWVSELQAVQVTEDRGTVRKLLDSIADELRIARIWKAILAVSLFCFLIWLLARKV